ncbi:RraA family protein [Falsirhodobacter sp. 20TX0035]|uniref:RraA family protein n=1 Tax=Falsirhodobacter sp. 20TX0035 TaxID=3022019 RepID=UPI0023306158|nr:RraA family protein [Falsirhodobacter sp. 20TX0035]MDB6454938.1 RraA family protein [Falsirhodobacter sp. 20TX0035]
MDKIGIRIMARPEQRCDMVILEAFRQLGVAQVSDCMGRLYGSVGLQPIHGHGLRMAGIALTVKTRPGDNLMIHRAIDLAQPGDVIVVDGSGCTANALVGELMMQQAQKRGVLGFVIDGAVRDAEAFGPAGFACFARGISHRGPFKDGPGEINVPVSVGGLVVQPGDVILGDTDGLTAIPPAYAAEVLRLAEAKEQAEAKGMERIAAGTYEKPWQAPAIARLEKDYK